MEVLAVLISHPTQELHQSMIAIESGLARIQVQRVLKRLESEGMVEEYQKGNMVCYRVNQSHPLMSDIKNILYKTIMLTQPLQHALENEKGNLDFAFVHGSFAKGTETPDSDIDLLIVGSVSLKSLSRLLAPVAKQLQREINPVVYSKNEFIEKVKAKDHFISTVMASKKLWLIGTDDEFTEMVK